MQKTIVVKIATNKMHPLYKKRYKTSKKYKAHDEKEVAKVGDVVEITASRPRSKEKKWILKRVMEQV